MLVKTAMMDESVDGDDCLLCGFKSLGCDLNVSGTSSWPPTRNIYQAYSIERSCVYYTVFIDEVGLALEQLQFCN